MNRSRVQEKRPYTGAMEPGKMHIPLWTVEDCANYLGVNKLTVYRMVESREIPFQRLGRRKGIRFVPEIVKRWVLDETLEATS